MLVYCPELSPRLQYILDVILGKLLGIPYTLTNLEQEFIYHEGPKLAYSMSPVQDFPYLASAGLLFEPAILNQESAIGQVLTWNDLPVFYPVKEPSILPFDIFSASFYLISRYEEYLPSYRDEHGRFASTESLAFRHDFLELPIINLWARELKKVLQNIFPGEVPTKEPSFEFVPTIDVDNAWAFTHKGWRNLVSLFKRSSMSDRNYRYQVFHGNQPDPYDQYAFLKQAFSGRAVKPVYFFLLGELGRHDRNVSPRNRHLKKLIRQISTENEVGIHPSYRSNMDRKILESEIKNLAKITLQQIEHSRQHYLKFSLPETYQNLIHLGIKKEYSMGYADHIGFRAGIAHPFPFFDLENNRSTELLVIPFQVMDVSLQQYMKLDPDEAIEQISQLIQKIREVGGTFSILWHNESLSEWKQWKGWSLVFRRIIELTSE